MEDNGGRKYGESREQLMPTADDREGRRYVEDGQQPIPAVRLREGRLGSPRR